jgi:hypothetical protein
MNQSELQKHLEALVEDPDAPPTAKVRALEVLARMIAPPKEVKVEPELPPDPMADLDELSLRRSRRSA